MAKTAFEVDRVKLTTAITAAELEGPLRNRSVLHEIVAEVYNKNTPPRPITAAVVGLRIKEWKLEVKTPIGKRGRQGPMTEEHKEKLRLGRTGKRASRADKFAKIEGLAEGFEELRQKVPERFLPVVDRLENGSMKAGLILHCLDCTGYCVSEIKRCSAGVQMCQLWPFRPYQKTVSDEDESLAAELDQPETEAA